MAISEWERQQMRDIMAEQRRRDACQRKALRAAATLLNAEVEYGGGDPLGAALRTVEMVARQLNLVREPKTKPSNRKQIGRGVQRQVWDRDEWTCKRCGGHTNLTVDHIVPVSRGGLNDLDNLQTLCGSCNSSKGAR